MKDLFVKQENIKILEILWLQPEKLLATWISRRKENKTKNKLYGFHQGRSCCTVLETLNIVKRMGEDICKYIIRLRISLKICSKPIELNNNQTNEKHNQKCTEAMNRHPVLIWNPTSYHILSSSSTCKIKYIVSCRSALYQLQDSPVCPLYSPSVATLWAVSTRITLYLQMNSLKAKDSTVYYCGKGTLRGPQCEHKISLVEGDQDHQGVHTTHHFCLEDPGAGADGGSGRVSCQGLGLLYTKQFPSGASLDIGFCGDLSSLQLTILLS